MPISDTDFQEMMEGPPPGVGAHPGQPVTQQEFDEIMNPPAQTEPQTWAQYAGDPSHSMWQRVGAAGIEEGRRIGTGLYNAGQSAITGDWFAPLARSTGEETLQNTATPATAGRVATAASLTTPGDMLVPGVSAKMVPGVAKVPSAEELYTTAGGQFDAARGMGVEYSVPHVAAVANGVVQKLYDRGILPTDAPRTYAKLSVLSTPPDGHDIVPLSGIEGARRGFSQLTADGSASAADRAAATLALGDIHGFMEAGTPDAVVAGPASAAADALAKARGNYAAAKRSDLITNTEQAADNRAASTNSGRNYDNTIRQTLRPLVDPRYPQRLSGFSPDERQAVQDVVRGNSSTGQNTLRTIGGLGAGGHGIATTALGLGMGAMGEHYAGPAAGLAAGIAAPLAGTIARNAQNSMARKAVEGLGEKIRQRSPLFQDRQGNTPFDVTGSPRGIALLRGELASPQSNDQPYARGGQVRARMSHEQLVARLFTLVERAKKAEKERTKPILRVPDEAVAHALKLAYDAI
jgi:hypothetical protein